MAKAAELSGLLADEEEWGMWGKVLFLAYFAWFVIKVFIELPILIGSPVALLSQILLAIPLYGWAFGQKKPAGPGQKKEIGNFDMKQSSQNPKRPSSYYDDFT